METKSLDGETNLKHKAAPLETAQLNESFYKNITIESEMPSDKIYSFRGVLKFTGQEVPLSYENIALRGCTLRNTDFFVGVVTYVGPDTRVMRNSTTARPK